MSKLGIFAVTAATKTATKAVSLGIGGITGRMALGGAIGGMYGAFTSDDPKAGFIGGAALGAAAGGLSRFLTPKLGMSKGSLGMPIGYKTTIPAAFNMGTKIASTATKTGLKAASFVIRHPYLTAGTIGGVAFMRSGIGVTPQSQSLESDEMISYAQLNQELEAQGNLTSSFVSPIGSVQSGGAARNSRLQRSTMGLVQGLHSSRH